MMRPNILILLDASREGNRRFIQGVANYAGHFGPWSFHWESLWSKEISERLRTRHFDGIVTRILDIGKSLSDDENTPMVITQHNLENIPQNVVVANNDEEAINTTVAKHFLQHGFRNFAFCGFNTQWSKKRESKYRELINGASHNLNSIFLEEQPFGDTLKLDQIEIAKEWLSSLPTPVAIMVAIDDLGWPLIQLCGEIGLRVPEDCAVVGVGNDPLLCNLSSPTLSSVGLQMHQAGYRAAGLLDKMIKGKEVEQCQIKVGTEQLAIRHSSDILAVDDVVIRKALRFINDNSLQPVLVDDVARVSGVCRRTLEKRFRKSLSKTIKRYISEIRADQIATILADTELTIESIAEKSGFSETSHLTRFFCNARGESPSAYRKRILGD